MEPATPTISPAPSTIITGASPSPGATSGACGATNDVDYLRKASGPTDGGGLQLVEGDFRELQGSLWMHDHRFFFTAENVHKGMFALANIYSGPDRGYERDLGDGINLRLPSGWLNGKSWGNTISTSTSPSPTRPRARTGSCSSTSSIPMALSATCCGQRRLLPVFQRAAAALSFPHPQRLDVALHQAGARRQPGAVARGTKVPFHFIANDGNLVVKPIKLTELDEQGIGERYDIVVDFRTFSRATASTCPTF